MKVLTKDEFEYNKREFLRDIADGALFIYPTDTIYGIGCNALSSEAVDKIRKIKKHSRPFSVIAPSKEWIKDNCKIDARGEEWLDKLPGPYTLILNLKNNDCISEEVNKGTGTVGVRMIEHWFQQAVTELGLPIITTSANKTGEDFMTNLENLDPDIKLETEFIVYEDEKSGSASTIVNLSEEETKIRKR